MLFQEADRFTEAAGHHHRDAGAAMPCGSAMLISMGVKISIWVKNAKEIGRPDFKWDFNPSTGARSSSLGVYCSALFKIPEKADITGLTLRGLMAARFSCYKDCHLLFDLMFF